MGRFDWLYPHFSPRHVAVTFKEGITKIFCPQMSGEPRQRQEPFCFPAQHPREVSNVIEHLRDLHPIGPTKIISILQGQVICHPECCRPLGNLCSVHGKPKFLLEAVEKVAEWQICSQKEITKSLKNHRNRADKIIGIKQNREAEESLVKREEADLPTQGHLRTSTVITWYFWKFPPLGPPRAFAKMEGGGGTE